MVVIIVIIIVLLLALFAFGWLVEMGFRNQTIYVYDPLYKCRFEFGSLNEEQETRFVPGSNRLADPPKGTKRQPPYWKEQRTLRRKILIFITMGNRPKPRGASGRNVIDDEIKPMQKSYEKENH